jgi:hypothetical protein
VEELMRLATSLLLLVVLPGVAVALERPVPVGNRGRPFSEVARAGPVAPPPASGGEGPPIRPVADRSSISRSLQVISSQLRLGHQLQLQAMDALTADGVSAAASARELTQQGYVQLRFAAHNINLRMEMAKFTDPLLEYVLAKVERAREHNRLAIAKLGEAVNDGNVAHVSAALDQLDQVVAILEEAILLMP